MAIASPPVPVSPITQLRGCGGCCGRGRSGRDVGCCAGVVSCWRCGAEMDRQEAAFARRRALRTPVAWVRWMVRRRRRRGCGRRGGCGRAMRGPRSRPARCRELLAETGEAWRAGEVSSAAFRTIAAARVDGYDDMYVRVRGRSSWTWPAATTCVALRRATAHFRRLALADGTEPSAHDGLHVSRLLRRADRDQGGAQRPRGRDRHDRAARVHGSARRAVPEDHEPALRRSARADLRGRARRRPARRNGRGRRCRSSSTGRP